MFGNSSTQCHETIASAYVPTGVRFACLTGAAARVVVVPLRRVTAWRSLAPAVLRFVVLEPVRRNPVPSCTMRVGVTAPSLMEMFRTVY